MEAQGVTGYVSIDHQDLRRRNPFTTAGLSLIQITLARVTSGAVCSPTQRYGYLSRGGIILVESNPISPSITLLYILDMGVHKIIAKRPRIHIL
jgi:hypothetical protein